MSTSRENNILEMEELHPSLSSLTQKGPMMIGFLQNPMPLEFGSTNWQNQVVHDFKKFLGVLPVGVLVMDANGNHYYTNHVAQQILGKTNVFTIPLSLWAEEGLVRLAGTTQNYPYEQIPLVKALKGETVMVNDIEVVGIDQQIPLEMWAVPVFDENLVIQYVIAVFQDITQRRLAESRKLRSVQEEAKRTVWQLEEQLQQEILNRQKAEIALQQAHQELAKLVTVDELTQLPNRRRLHEYLNQEWRRLTREKQPLSLVICSIDLFEDYQALYGAKAGDACFQQIAQAVVRVAKRPSDLVGRYGETEFAAILPNTEADGAVQVASAMRWEVKLLRIAHAQSPVGRYVTLSVGVSSGIPTHTSSVDILVTMATAALEEAKQQGRNRVILKNVGNRIEG